jgi:hypothetical protein
VNLGWEVLFARVDCRQSSEGEGPYPAGGVGYPRLALFALCLLGSRVDSPRVWVEAYLARLQRDFCEKMRPFFWGDAPRSSPRGGLGFQEKAESPFDFINSVKFTFVQPTGVLGM